MATVTSQPAGTSSTTSTVAVAPPFFSTRVSLSAWTNAAPSAARTRRWRKPQSPSAGSKLDWRASFEGVSPPACRRRALRRMSGKISSSMAAASAPLWPSKTQKTPSPASEAPSMDAFSFRVASRGMTSTRSSSLPSAAGGRGGGNVRRPSRAKPYSTPGGVLGWG